MIASWVIGHLWAPLRPKSGSKVLTISVSLDCLCIMWQQQPATTTTTTSTLASPEAHGTHIVRKYSRTNYGFYKTNVARILIGLSHRDPLNTLPSSPLPVPLHAPSSPTMAETCVCAFIILVCWPINFQMIYFSFVWNYLLWQQRQQHRQQQQHSNNKQQAQRKCD